MAENSISPAFAKVRYVANGHTHYMTFGLNPVDFSDPTDILVETKNGTTVSLDTWFTSQFGPLWAAFYKATDTLVEYEFWSKPTPESDPVFIGVTELSTVGTNVSTTPNLLAGQGVLTMRSSGGGISKLYLMEPAVANNVVDPRPFTDTRVSDIASDLVHSSSVWYARDNGYPLIGLNWFTKVNDALRKKYLLDNV